MTMWRKVSRFCFRSVTKSAIQSIKRRMQRQLGQWNLTRQGRARIKHSPGPTRCLTFPCPNTSKLLFRFIAKFSISKWRAVCTFHSFYAASTASILLFIHFHRTALLASLAHETKALPVRRSQATMANVMSHMLLPSMRRELLGHGTQLEHLRAMNARDAEPRR